jgi:hypothetical protein
VLKDNDVDYSNLNIPPSEPRVYYIPHKNTIIVDKASEIRKYYESATSTQIFKLIVTLTTFGHGRLIHSGYYEFDKKLENPKDNCVYGIVSSNSGNLDVFVKCFNETCNLKHASLDGEMKSCIPHFTTVTTSSIDSYKIMIDGKQKNGYHNWNGGYVASPSEIGTWRIFQASFLILLIYILFKSVIIWFTEEEKE